MRVQGDVVERSEVALLPSEARDGFYPLRALVAGVKWPEGVDPARREQYLSPGEFEGVFGMTKVSARTLRMTAFSYYYSKRPVTAGKVQFVR